MWEQLKRIWKLGDPKYLDFLDRQTRHSLNPRKQDKDTFNQYVDRSKDVDTTPWKPATVIQDDPLEVFPMDEEDLNNLTGEKND